jgi:hypothetical protein
MSGPSSSDLTTRKKFLITERADPLPCCAPAATYVFAFTDLSGSIPSPEYVSSVTLNPNPTSLIIKTLTPIVVTGQANISANAGASVVMKVTYSIGTSPTEYIIVPDTTLAFPVSGNANIFGSRTFTPSAVDTYRFYLYLKRSAAASAYYNTATLYAQGT